jgi:hypothetical protein
VKNLIERKKINGAQYLIKQILKDEIKINMSLKKEKKPSKLKLK